MRSWYSKHQPTDLDEVVFPDDATFRAQVSAWRKIGILGHNGLLLHGRPGTGKSAFIQAFLRTLNIPEFATYACNSAGVGKADLANLEAFLGRWNGGLVPGNADINYVICEEIDYYSRDFIAGLRGLIDTYCVKLNIGRFMFTTNDFEKVQKVAGFTDRLYAVDFNKPHRDDLTQRLNYILQRERRECSEQELSNIIGKNFPSVRAMITELQLVSHRRPRSSGAAMTSPPIASA